MADNTGSKSRHMDAEPKFRRLAELKRFTDNFSNVLGEGSFGTVYKGIDDEKKEIAVKVLHERKESQEEEFKREFYNLLKLRHQNMIQLVGYCYGKDEKYNSITERWDPIIRTALCFEYAPKGNLRKHISVEGDRLDWHTCYKIIKGTCEGLCYLHIRPSGSEIWHLDLKPENILLNHDMIPKIADFGLSRLISDQTSKATKTVVGTGKYTPMEFITKRVISKEFDIYGLGVIIWEIVAGTKSYNDTDDFSQEVIDHVLEKWSKKLTTAYCQQVKTCLEIAAKCLQIDRRKRPKISKILDDLNQVENMITKVSVSHKQRNNSGSSEVPNKFYSSWERKDNTRVIKQDKDARRQNETQQYASTSSSRSTGSDAKVVLYVTTMGGIAKTFNDCNTIRAALDSYGVDYIEKDLFDRPDHQKEVKKLLAGTSYKLPVPVLCINSVPVGDARELLKLHEEGTLAALFK